MTSAFFFFRPRDCPKIKQLSFQKCVSFHGLCSTPPPPLFLFVHPSPTPAFSWYVLICSLYFVVVFCWFLFFLFLRFASGSDCSVTQCNSVFEMYCIFTFKSHSVIVSLRCTALLFLVSCIIYLNHLCSIPLCGAHHLLLPSLLNHAAMALNPYLFPRPDWYSCNPASLYKVQRSLLRLQYY